MFDLQGILKSNPKAAREMDIVKEVLETMRLLREAGVAKSDIPAPLGKRPVLDGLKARGANRQNIKRLSSTRASI